MLKTKSLLLQNKQEKSEACETAGDLKLGQQGETRFAGVSEDALTRGDPYPDQARLSLQCERTIPCSSTVHFSSTVRLEEVCFSAVRFNAQTRSLMQCPKQVQ